MPNLTQDFILIGLLVLSMVWKMKVAKQVFFGILDKTQLFLHRSTVLKRTASMLQMSIILWNWLCTLLLLMFGDELSHYKIETFFYNWFIVIIQKP